MRIDFVFKLSLAIFVLTYPAFATTLTDGGNKKPIFQNNKTIHSKGYQYTNSPPVKALDASSSVISDSKNTIPRISYDTLTIYYATDRQVQKDFTGYGNNKDTSQKPIHYGSVIFKNTNLKTFQINSINSKENFLDSLKKSKKKKILIFIPGFNMDFKKSVTTLANFINDSNFEGTAVMYSWASAHNILQYSGDIDSIEWSTPYIEEFINDILKNADTKEVYILAHSMGSRGLAAIFKNSSMNYSNLKSIIFAAPDIDATIFKRDYLKNIQNSKALITIYISSNDRALLFSHLLNNDKRLGEAETAEERSNWNDIDVIDISEIETNIIGHSYIFYNQFVLGDVQAIFNKAEKATLRKQNNHNGYNLIYNKYYWKMVKQKTTKNAGLFFTQKSAEHNKSNLRRQQEQKHGST